MQKKISIIVPVYNMEKYLEECLNSIKKQSYSNFEVLIVDDGSSDNSINICNDIVKQDARFKLIKQKNAGVSAARNRGIEHANGDILIFVDSDDYISQDLLETVNNNFENNSLLCFGYYKKYKKKQISCLIDEGNNVNNILNGIYLSNDIGGFLWNKAFDSKIIKRNNIRLNEKIHYCEDLLFVDDYMQYCSIYKYVNKPLYYYRMRSNSVSYKFNNKKNISILDAYSMLLSRFSNNTEYCNHFQYIYLFYFYKLRNVIKKYNYEYDKSIIENERQILRKAGNRKKFKILFMKKFYIVYLFFVYLKKQLMHLYD